MGRLTLSVLSALLLVPQLVLAQAREVTGRVTQQGSGAPLVEATINVVGQPIGTRTDAEGNYRLRVPAGDITLQARALGFKRTTTRLAAGQTTANFTLERDVLQLEGVTVTGQATTIDRRQAQTAIASVSAEELNRVPARSLEQQLQGKVIGAQISMNSGAPGGGGQILLRGATSVIGNSDPLFVVDGVVVSNAGIASGANSVTRAAGAGNISSGQDNVVNRLADINPDEIESVEVLKSAAASAIYGSRASNGVVVITTKRGRAGAPRFTVTQRVGTQQLMRNLESRRFPNAAAVQAAVSTAAPVQAAAAAACTGGCPWFDYQSELFGNNKPSTETVLSTSGGAGANTRYFLSATDKNEQGIAINTGARRQAVRFNLDQNISPRLTVSAGANLTRNVLRRGLSNNDNTYTSPIYNFAYTPAVIDLNRRDEQGMFIRNPFASGGNLANTSNPFETFNFVRNNEDVFRQQANARVNYTIFSAGANNVQFSYVGGFDQFSQDNSVYSPNFLQFENNDGLPGTASQSNSTSLQTNNSLNAVWTFSPGGSLLNSATTSFGAIQENQNLEVNRAQARGLIATVPRFDQGTNLLAQGFSVFKDQRLYASTTLSMLGEKLNVTAGVSAERSSANGDRDQFYTFPRFAGAYRFVDVIPAVEELKLRASYGRTGNRPRFGDRDVLFNGAGNIAGQNAIVAAGLLGNPDIMPETLNETELGFDATLFKSRVALETTWYQRRITDLLLTFPLTPSSGLGNKVINGGEMTTTGWEVGATIVPVQRGAFTWTSRTNFSQYLQILDTIPVPPFPVLGSFGPSFGRNRMQSGQRTTWVWGFAPLGANGAVVDTILGDSRPDFQMQFVNTFDLGSFSVSTLVDWRKGGLMANMTKLLYDEGQNSRDYDDPSPNASVGATLGEWRYETWAAGDIRPYVEDGSYVKLREVTLSYTAPRRWARFLPGDAKDLRFSLQGRNLLWFSDYWSYDPEFNNFGNSNFNRFIDLAPFPPNRQMFFSVDIGF